MLGIAENAWVVAAAALPALATIVVAFIAVRRGSTDVPRAVAGIVVVFVLAGLFLYWSYTSWTPAVPAADEGPQGAVRVEMTDASRFQPASITIAVGDTVEWINLGRTAGHTVTADPDATSDPDLVRLPAGAESFDSGVMPIGSTHRHRFTVAGRYVYFCRQHADEGMIGEVVVE